jgi:hypothetical protein
MRFASIIVGALLLAQQASCVRVELDKSEDRTGEVGEQALRISATDSVVLCPLAAAAGPSGQVSIVWAGYPPADDRLQLMHALVSATGELEQPPRAIALLDSELASLEVERTDRGLELRATEESVGEMITVQIDERGAALDSSRQPAPASGPLENLCESHVFTSEAKLSIFRSQVDGEFPLFVQSNPY